MNTKESILVLFLPVFLSVSFVLDLSKQIFQKQTELIDAQIMCGDIMTDCLLRLSASNYLHTIITIL